MRKSVPRAARQLLVTIEHENEFNRGEAPSQRINACLISIDSHEGISQLLKESQPFIFEMRDLLFIEVDIKSKVYDNTNTQECSPNTLEGDSSGIIKQADS